MNKFRLKEQELRNLGYTEAKAIAAAMKVMTQHYRHLPKERRLMLLKDILINPFGLSQRRNAEHYCKAIELTETHLESGRCSSIASRKLEWWRGRMPTGEGPQYFSLMCSKADTRECEN